MTYADFRTRLQALVNLSRGDLERATSSSWSDEQWTAFCYSPADWFLMASDEEAERVFQALEKKAQFQALEEKSDAL